MRKWILSLFCILFILCGCTSENEDAGKPTVIIGIDDFEPYSYINSKGEFAGLDVELAKECFKRLGYNVEFKVIKWANKDEYLSDGTIDCIWSCYSMNGREDLYDWAGPYLYSRQVVLVANDSDIKTLEDLSDKRIGVKATTKGENVFLHNEDFNIPSVKQIDSYSSTEDMFSAIRKAYVDAICGHEALLSNLLSENYRLLNESPSLSKLGVAFKKDSKNNLVSKLNDTLKEIRDDGTLQEIVTSYGLDSSKVMINE